jgi:hypothetical protein
MSNPLNLSNIDTVYFAPGNAALLANDFPNVLVGAAYNGPQAGNAAGIAARANHSLIMDYLSVTNVTLVNGVMPAPELIPWEIRLKSGAYHATLDANQFTLAQYNLIVDSDVFEKGLLKPISNGNNAYNHAAINTLITGRRPVVNNFLMYKYMRYLFFCHKTGVVPVSPIILMNDLTPLVFYTPDSSDFDYDQFTYGLRAKGIFYHSGAADGLHEANALHAIWAGAQRNNRAAARGGLLSSQDRVSALAGATSVLWVTLANSMAPVPSGQVTMDA